MSALERNGHGLSEERALERDEQAGEALMMGLRLREGVDLAALAVRTGLTPAKLIDEKAVAQLAGHGLLRREGDHLTATPAGMLLLDRILGDIVVV